MTKRNFIKRSLVQAPAAELFAWHESADAFSKLLPPFESVRVLCQSGGIKDGAEVKLAQAFGPLELVWHLRHEGYVEGVEFCDVQVEGPFKTWRHRHRVVPVSDSSSFLEDAIEYEMPLGIVGDIAGHWMVQNKLDRLFNFRHEVTKRELENLAGSAGN